MKERPVNKVINLLRTMQEELQSEGEADKQLFDKLTCWCETNGKNKALAIATAERTIEALSAEIQQTTAKSQELESQITSLAEEIAKNEEALDKASAMRTTDLADFNSDEKEMLSTITALKGAVITLSKHHESFLQTEVGTALRRVRSVLTKARMDSAQREKALALLSQPAGFQSYAPASGQIFGILKQMKETFENNLSESQKTEKQAASDFVDLKAAKTEEITSANTMKDSKTQELADTNEQRAAAKQNKKDTTATLEADQAFVVDMTKRCAASDADYEERTKARQEEIMAVGEALEMLTGDDAHELFGKSLGFVQKVTSSRRTRLTSALSKAGHQLRSSALVALAARAQLDSFEAVKKAIDEMVVALKQEQKDEVKHRDFCIAEFAENDKQQAVAQDELADLGAEIENLKATLDTLTDELHAANAEVSDTKTAMKRAGEDREIENTEFQQTVADQRAAQDILTRVLQRLKQVYLFAQQPMAGGADQPQMPEGFKEHKQNKNAGGVLGMIQQIIDEAKAMEMDALRAEQDSQSAYEDYTKNGNHAISTLSKAIADKTEKKAQAEARLVQANEDRAATLKASDGLNAYKGNLHTSCDFVLENFEVRQSRRSDEMDALAQAKAILSGAQ